MRMTSAVLKTAKLTSAVLVEPSPPTAGKTGRSLSTETQGEPMPEDIWSNTINHDIVDKLTDEQVDELLAILKKAGY